MPVLFDNVIDNLASALFAEVDIKIGHTDALRVQKALKQQVVFYRVYIGDTYAVGAQ